MPFDIEGIVVKFGLKVVLQKEHQGIQGWVCNKLIIRVVLIFITSLFVDVESTGFIEHFPRQGLEIHIPEFKEEFFHQGSMF